MSPEEALAAALQSLDNGGRDVPDGDALGFASDLSAALTAEGYTIVRSDELARLREAASTLCHFAGRFSAGDIDIDRSDVQVAIDDLRAALEARP